MIKERYKRYIGQSGFFDDVGNFLGNVDKTVGGFIYNTISNIPIIGGVYKFTVDSIIAFSLQNIKTSDEYYKFMKEAISKNLWTREEANKLKEAIALKSNLDSNRKDELYTLIEQRITDKETEKNININPQDYNIPNFQAPEILQKNPVEIWNKIKPYVYTISVGLIVFFIWRILAETRILTQEIKGE